MKYLIILLLFSCAAWGQGVTVTIHNKTGFDVDSLYFSGERIGFAKKDTTITIYNFKRLTKRDGGIRTYVFGVIKGKKKDIHQFPSDRCGTGVESVTEGKYTFDLIYFERDSMYQIYVK